MKSLWVILFLTAFVFACSNKKKKQATDEEFFPVVTYLRGQAAQMDSSLATIMKIEKLQNGRPDTTYIKREEFKFYAKEFLDLPDISSAKLKDDYTVTNMYDDLLNAYIFTYTTTEEDLPIKKQDVIVEPGENENNIQAINIDKWEKKDDSLIHKNMLWESNKRFLIVTKVQKGSQPEVIKTLEVKWTNAPRGY